eukprot:266609-Pyramimonas_sp.AAC.1
MHVAHKYTGMTSLPSPELQLPVLAPDSPETRHDTYAPVARARVGSWLALPDEDRDDGAES